MYASIDPSLLGAARARRLPMRYLPAVLALLVATAGWFYLFNPRAAQRLRGIEPGRANRLRIRLRQASGLIMLLTASCLYGGFRNVHQQLPSPLAVITLMALLLGLIVLAMIDLHLTWRLRRRDRAGDPPSGSGRIGSCEQSRPHTRDTL